MSTEPHDSWSSELFDLLVGAGITLFPYVPDAGNKRLIELAAAHNESRPVLLSSEEEGVAICAGADLVGQRGVLCMQSSGLGNCTNFLSFVKGGGFPILMLVTMRGDYGEGNPWQYPMGQAVEPILHTMGVLTYRVERREDLLPAAEAAVTTSGNGRQAAALILSQRFLGAKAF
jgi:sulfopyruvate decarboxylase alpha subunit